MHEGLIGLAKREASPQIVITVRRPRYVRGKPAYVLFRFSLSYTTYFWLSPRIAWKKPRCSQRWSFTAALVGRRVCIEADF
jgi:hypothetical protein